MSKRFLSVFLVLVLSVLVAVPAFASSTGTLIKLEDKSKSSTYYSNYGKVRDASTNSEVTFDYSVPDGGATVLLFYSAADANGSAATFSDLGSVGWANSSKINFIAIESNKSSASASSAFISQYDKNGFVDKAYYDTNDQHLLMWYYTYIQNDGSMNGSIGYNVAYCYAVFITSENSKNYIRYSLSGVTSSSQIASALSKIMDTSALATGYDGYLDSGVSSVGKMSKPSIASLLDENANYTPATNAGYFDTAPVVSGSYSTGKVKDSYLRAATNRLSALRNIAGLPSVTMDSELNSQAQYGAVLLANSKFAHETLQPSDMDDSFFEKGYAATMSSNIAAGRHLTSTPDGFMKDEGDNNLPVMGHRRWQLNPDLLKVGFGFAVNENNVYNASHELPQYIYYTTEKCMDTSGDVTDYRFISWPASGNFPVQTFDSDTAWSVTLNPAYYQTPAMSSVKVTVTRTSDSKKWTFSNSETYSVSATGKYFNVETNAYGIGNCIIFRPNGVSTYDGEYTVVISGIKDSFGNSVSLSYKVDFFNANDYRNLPSGWYEENGNKYYINTDGSIVKSKLLEIEGKKYYFGKDGAMYTKRLISVSGNKYYMGADGAAYTKRLISVNGKKYYMGADGIAYKSRLISVSGNKYYIGSDCVAYKSKIATVDSKTYYFGSDCVMVKSKLVTYDGYKYYLGKDGVAYKSKLISVDGKKYYIGSDCKAYKSKFGTIDGKKYYFGSDSVMVKSKLISVSGSKYYMGSDGAAYKSKLISVSGKKYYIGSDYKAYKSKFASISGKKYYFGSDCVMYKSKTFSVSGVKWKADSNGVCTKA